jgi:hypothetical protein
LHPRDRFIPWWGRRPERRNIQNITYVNRNYITVVHQSTFISSRNVSNNIVRDSVIVRETNSVRVMEQPLPIPNRSSLRVRADGDNRRLQRPPATVVSRPAVVRVTPVPPPPTFQEKLPEIQKARGEPVAPDKAQTMGLANLKASKRRNPIRPAAVESGRGDFAPRTPGTSAPAAQPLTAPRGKKLATAEAPVVTNTPQRPERSERPAKSDQKAAAPSAPSKSPGAVQLQENEQQQSREPQKRGKQPQEQQQLREEQKRQAQERQQLQEQERQKQETRLQKQPQKEAPQARKEQQREEPERAQLERRQPQKQERELQQTQSQQRKAPPEPRKESQRERQKRQDEEKKGGTPEPDRS